MAIASANGHSLHTILGTQGGAGSAVERKAADRIGRLIDRCVKHYGHDAVMAIDADTIDMSGDMSLDEQLAEATGKPSIMSGMLGTRTAQVELGLFPDSAVDWPTLTETCQAQMRAYRAQYA